MTKQDRAIELIKSLEAFRAATYLDSAGNLTIGYGLAFHYPDTTPIKLGDVCTVEQATGWLADILKVEVFPFIDKLYDQYAFNDDVYVAVSSLIYNVGKNRPGPFFYKALMSIKLGHGMGDLAAALRMYDKIRDITGKLVVCQGLANRREKEIAVFMKTEGIEE